MSFKIGISIQDMLVLLLSVEDKLEEMAGESLMADDALDDLRPVITEVAAACEWIENLTGGARATVN
jgi:hypothetical protein